MHKNYVKKLLKKYSKFVIFSAIETIVKLHTIKLL